MQVVLIIYQVIINFKDNVKEREELEKRLIRIKEIHAGTKDIIRRIRVDLLKSNCDFPQLDEETLFIFSKWGNTGGSKTSGYEPDDEEYKPNAQDEMRKLSEYLFGKVIERLDGDKYHK